MAGSLKFFTYTADDGTLFAAYRDESNVEAANTGGTILISTAAKYKLPSNVRARHAVFVDTTGRIRRDVTIMNPTAYAALDAASTIVDQVSGETLRLKLKEGERITLPTLADTALNDGDLS
jgi:hypothetical protein